MFDDLEQYEVRVRSQNGEDGIIRRLLNLVGETNRYFVEFGVGPCAQQCNTRHLADQGWNGLWMDCAASPHEPRVKQECITAENINDLFAKHRVPCEFDLLSLDIDGNDYWVWSAIDTKYRPRVIVAEYNASVPPSESRAIAYEPEFRWQRTDYFGASLLALSRLAARRGYTLVYCDSAGVNSFFVRNDLTGNWRRSVAELYRPADYKKGRLTRRLLPKFMSRLLPQGVGHPADPVRRLIEVE